MSEKTLEEIGKKVIKTSEREYKFILDSLDGDDYTRDDFGKKLQGIMKNESEEIQRKMRLAFNFGKFTTLCKFTRCLPKEMREKI